MATVYVVVEFLIVPNCARIIFVISDFIFNIADGYDIEYNYGIRISGDVSGRLDTSLRLGVTSIADRAGGNISLGIIYDNDDFYAEERR